MKVFYLYQYRYRTNIFIPANRYIVKNTGVPLNTGIRIDTCTLSHHSAFTMYAAIIMHSVYTRYCESETLPLFSNIINLSDSWYCLYTLVT